MISYKHPFRMKVKSNDGKQRKREAYLSGYPSVLSKHLVLEVI